jgi:hypothetical protein
MRRQCGARQGHWFVAEALERRRLLSTSFIPVNQPQDLA